MTTKIKPICLLFGLLAMVCVFGQEHNTFNADSTFFNARMIAFSGERAIARDSLKKILQKYPEYLDVEVFYAKTLSWDGRYDEARDLFNKLTSGEKHNRELWLASIKNELYAERYSLVLGLSNKALQYFPDDAKINELQRDAAKKVQGEYEIYEVLKKENSAQAVKNSIAMSSEVQAFDKYIDPFFKSSLQYKRNTKIGAVIPRVNYVERFNLKGVQYELDMYPRISKKLHGYLNYGYSEASILPRQRLGAELYIQLPLAMEASLGVRHLAFEELNTTIYTGSFGLYTGNYYFSLRPYLSYAEGDIGFAGNILARKYLKNAQNYLGLNLTYGINAENNQFFNNDVLLAESLVYLSSAQLKLSYQFTGRSNMGSFQTSLSFSRQEVPFSPNEFVHSASIGLQYQFNF